MWARARASRASGWRHRGDARRGGAVRGVRARPSHRVRTFRAARGPRQAAAIDARRGLRHRRARGVRFTVFLLAPRALVKIPPAHRALAVAFACTCWRSCSPAATRCRTRVSSSPSCRRSSRFICRLHILSRGPVFWLRTSVAVGLAAWVFASAGPRGRHVIREREDLIRRATPVLAGAKTIAAVDVGWVSACADVAIVDLAGLTDPDIAALPGGHTSKRVLGRDAPRSPRRRDRALDDRAARRMGSRRRGASRPRSARARALHRRRGAAARIERRRLRRLQTSCSRVARRAITMSTIERQDRR